jgi:transcriptional regulator with XRE-family HTH domain
MDIVSRLKQFMDFTQLPSSQFADMAQIPRPTLSQIMNGRNKKISNELISKLHEAFPQLNVLWLMFGDGDMVFNENTQFSEPENELNLFTQDAQPTVFQSNAEPEVEEDNDIKAEASTQDVPNAPLSPLPIITDNTKKIASIMVFYSDNSFERFVPAES